MLFRSSRRCHSLFSANLAVRKGLANRAGIAPCFFENAWPACGVGMLLSCTMATSPLRATWGREPASACLCPRRNPSDPRHGHHFPATLTQPLPATLASKQAWSAAV
jgi:hypothetical protein